MDEQLSLAWPDMGPDESRAGMKNFEFIKALQIDEMVTIRSEAYKGFAPIALETYYSCDPEVLSYRLAVVDDLMRNDRLCEAFVSSIPMIRNIRDYWKSMTSDFTVESSLSCIRCLETYQEIVELFDGALKVSELQSEGMKRFMNAVRGIKESEDYRNLDKELSKTEVKFGHIKSITVGINLDEMLQPEKAGLIEINDVPFHEGTLMNRLLKKRSKDGMDFMAPMFPLSKGIHGEELRALNLGMQTALQTVFKQSIASFEPMVQRYYRMNTTLFVTLLDDIRFLTAGVAFIKMMRENGFSMCRPQIAPVEDKRCDLTGVYNPMLAMRQVEKMIVSNEFHLDENGRFYLVTGPNHGGKSIFAYSIGMAQALFQLGLFVPAKEAYMSPVTGIYTHFPSNDENNFGKGRLESECARLGGILREIRDTDLLLMDESFSSTSGLEAGYIASEVLTGIGIIGCAGIFVTHIHDLPQRVAEFNSHPDNKGRIDNLSALMENKADGTRSYRVVRTTPDGLSYARDIAGKYGLNLDQIIENRNI